MNHRERRNFLGEKKPEQNLWVTPSTVKLPCSTPWIASSSKSGASMLWSRSPVSQLLWIKDTPAANWKKKKSSPGHQHWDMTGPSNGNWNRKVTETKVETKKGKLFQDNSSLSPSSAAIPSESAMGPLLGVVSSPWSWGGSWGWAGWAIEILDTGRFLVDSGCTGRTTSKQLSKLDHHPASSRAWMSRSNFRITSAQENNCYINPLLKCVKQSIYIYVYTLSPSRPTIF